MKSKFGLSFAAILIFIGMQLLGSIVGGMVVAYTNGVFEYIQNNINVSTDELQRHVLNILMQPSNMAAMSVTSILISSIGTILLFRGIHWIAPDTMRPTPRTMMWGVSMLVVLALMINVAGELLEVPDINQSVFAEMMRTPLGLLCICVLGPVAEEVTFRGVIQGRWMRIVAYDPVRVRTAIIVQALLFGIIHLNPAQSYGATALGLLFGWVYYRTGSLWVPIVMHIVNNTAAVMLSLAYADTPLVQLLGGRYAAIYLCVVSVAALYWLLKQSQEIKG